MKLRYTFTLEFPVTDLAAYEADTLQEAAEKEMLWLRNGVNDPVDILTNAESFSVNVEAVE